MEGLVPRRGVITPHHFSESMVHPQPGCVVGNSFPDFWGEKDVKMMVMVGDLSIPGPVLLSAPALNLLPLWGCLLFLSACSSLIPQDFYSDSPGGFEINLDHRKLKTPHAKLFTVPSEALAIAVATEWDSQKDTIKFYTMHLTTLCNTALDNPTQRNKMQMIRAAVKFLETDTVCYRVEEPAALAELQKNEWDPIVAWAEKRYNVAIGSSTSILGPNIPTSTKETFVSHLASYNMWALQGIEYVITQLKSLILSMGLIDRHITVEKAVLLSRLEEEYQIQRWGSVEWAHDYDLYELRARAAAGTLFVHLCSESSTVKHKLLQD
uniref:ATP synthase mitochondrial F1 complex assembly factor 2 n=1 Tax=Otus sunia TaxID=257818 RepID=A0A8C8E8I0_9STRI